MERPFAVIGFTYLSALMVALIFREFLSFNISVVLLILFAVSLFIKPLRKSVIVPVVIITSSMALLLFSTYSSAYVAPVNQLYGKTTVVTARLCDIPYEQNGRYYYKLETQKNDIPNTVQNTKILVSSKNAYDMDMYDNITATIHFFDNSNSKYRNYNISKGIMIRGAIDDYSEVTIVKSNEKPLYYYALITKKNMAEIIQQSLPEKEASFIIALLLGDKTDISSEEKSNFISAGISHIVSVSGFHIAVITQIFMLLLNFIIKRERISEIICTFIVFVFMAVVGFSPSVVRAGIMQIIYLIGKCIMRQSDSLNSLGFAVLMICFLNPYSVADAGFLLSFCATLGIILCSPKMAEFIQEHLYKKRSYASKHIDKLEIISIPLFKSVISILTITISATIFTLPVTILFFKRIAIYSLLSNLLISFAASILIFSVLLMILFRFTVIFSFLAIPFTVITGMLSDYIMWVADFVSSIPYSVINVSESFIPLWLGSMMIIAALIFIIKDKRRSIRYFAFVAVVTFTFGSISNIIFTKGTFKISILDVGKGMSVIITENGETAVLSCGGESSYSSVLNDYLKNSGIQNIHYLLLTKNSDENSIFAEKLLDDFSVSNIQVYNEEKYYEHIHRLILQSENIIFSEENSKNSVYWYDTSIETFMKEDDSAIYFIKNNISFLFCEENTDCSVIPAKWRNPTFLVVDGVLKNSGFISPKYIIISDDYDNLSYDIPQLSLLSEHIYATASQGNIAVRLYKDNTISIRRENEWLS